MTRGRVLLTLAALLLAAPGPVAAQQPPAQELWNEYPLAPTETSPLVTAPPAVAATPPPVATTPPAPPPAASESSWSWWPLLLGAAALAGLLVVTTARRAVRPVLATSAHAVGAGVHALDVGAHALGSRAGAVGTSSGHALASFGPGLAKQARTWSSRVWTGVRVAFAAAISALRGARAHVPARPPEVHTIRAVELAPAAQAGSTTEPAAGADVWVVRTAGAFRSRFVVVRDSPTSEAAVATSRPFWRLFGAPTRRGGAKHAWEELMDDLAAVGWKLLAPRGAWYEVRLQPTRLRSSLLTALEPYTRPSELEGETAGAGVGDRDSGDAPRATA